MPGQGGGGYPGGLVLAIPTDALYTLVADPFNLRAVNRVYQARGRHINRSLPLRVRDMLMMEELTPEISPRFRLLARRFWPGPLTLIVTASPSVPLRAAGNTGRLGVRQAKSPVADALIGWLNQPLISTSANLSGHPTCRSGIAVFGMMDGRVDLVLDGGICEGMGASGPGRSGRRINVRPTKKGPPRREALALPRCQKFSRRDSCTCR